MKSALVFCLLMAIISSFAGDDAAGDDAAAADDDMKLKTYYHPMTLPGINFLN